MRDIEFRFYDTASKKMFGMDTVGQYEVEQLSRFSKTDDPYTKVMQFTGLLDAKGNKVFEGDLIENGRGRTAKVVWNEWKASFDCEFVSDEYSNPAIDKSLGFKNHQWCTCVEVIGNIYEHPYLIKGDE